MSGRQSAAVDGALRLIAGGMTVYRAAQTTGIAFSTAYRALARQRAAQNPPVPEPPEAEPPEPPA